MSRRFLGLLVASVALFGAGAARAADGVDFGVQASFADNDLNLGIGGRVQAPLDDLGRGVSLLGTFDLFFPDGDRNYWELNGNLVYTFHPRHSRVDPYVGGGLNISHETSDNNVGLNLLGGINIPARRVKPFVEAKIEVRDGGPLVISAGLRF